MLAKSQWILRYRFTKEWTFWSAVPFVAYSCGFSFGLGPDGVLLLATFMARSHTAKSALSAFDIEQFTENRCD